MGRNDDDDRRHKEIENLYSNVEDLKDNSKALAGNVINILRDIVFEANEKAKDQVLKGWLFDLNQEETDKLHDYREKFDKLFGPRPPLGSDMGLFNSEGLGLPMVGAFAGLADDFLGGSAGSTPFGLFARNAPSAKAYDTCLEKQGTQVWDSQGWWRCLFPALAVPAEMLKFKKERFGSDIMTKEDLEHAATDAGVDPSASKLDLGAKGIFFRHFEELLKWKRDNYTQYKAQQAQQLEQARQQRIEDTPSNEQDSFFRSSLVSSSYRTNPDTNMLEWHEKRSDTKSDGTTTTTVVTRERPVGSNDEWRVVDESTTTDHNKGWFWK